MSNGNSFARACFSQKKYEAQINKLTEQYLTQKSKFDTCTFFLNFHAVTSPQWNLNHNSTLLFYFLLT